MLETDPARFVVEYEERREIVGHREVVAVESVEGELFGARGVGHVVSLPTGCGRDRLRVSRVQ